MRHDMTMMYAMHDALRPAMRVTLADRPDDLALIDATVTEVDMAAFGAAHTVRFGSDVSRLLPWLLDGATTTRPRRSSAVCRNRCATPTGTRGCPPTTRGNCGRDERCGGGFGSLAQLAGRPTALERGLQPHRLRRTRELARQPL